MICDVRSMARIVVCCAAVSACIASGTAALAASTGTQLQSVNAQLQTIVHAPAQRTAAPEGVGAPRFPVIVVAKPGGQMKPLHLPPAIQRIARIERLLDIHTKTMSANLWGAFDGGRGCSIKFSFHI
jgi:hypothetical protein